MEVIVLYQNRYYIANYVSGKYYINWKDISNQTFILVSEY